MRVFRKLCSTIIFLLKTYPMPEQTGLRDNLSVSRIKNY